MNFNDSMKSECFITAKTAKKLNDIEIIISLDSNVIPSLLNKNGLKAKKEEIK